MTMKAYGAQPPTSRSSRSTSAPRARAPATCRSRSPIAASAIRTCTPCAREWGGHALSLRARPRDRRPVSARWARRSPRFKVGRTVGVGCMVDSCQHCASCGEGLEQYCENGFVGTYNGPTADAPGHTLGGYSQRIVVDEKLRAEDPPSRGPARRRRAAAVRRHHHVFAAAPLEVGPGQEGRHRRHRRARPHGRQARARDGRARRAFTTSESKRQDALDLGADEVVRLAQRATRWPRTPGSFDFILDTVAASHDLDAFTALLKRDGTLCLVGVPEHAASVAQRVQPDLQAAARSPAR